mgnify:CR=1 FL=1
MKTKIKATLVAGVLSVVSGSVFAVNSNSCANYSNGKCYYNSTVAVDSAKYGVAGDFLELDEHPTSAPHYDSNAYVSKVILSALVGNQWSAYNYRLEYLADENDYKNKGYLGWFFRGVPALVSYSDTWEFPDKFYKYAKGNKDTYKGMHFDYVTHDPSREYLDIMKIKKGDIIFADWGNDGIIDYTFLVTSLDSSKTNYDRIKVTYARGYSYPVTIDRSLHNINIGHNYKATFKVYRPTFYSDLGL